MKIIPLPSETRINLGYTHKVILTYADCTAAALTQTFTIFPDAATPGQLAAGFQVQASAIRMITPFSGGSISAMAIDIGDKASVGRYIANANTDLFTASATNTKDNVVSATRYAFAGADVANTNAQLTAKLTAVGGNLNTATAGRVEIYLDLAPLADGDVVVEPGIVG